MYNYTLVWGVVYEVGGVDPKELFYVYMFYVYITDIILSLELNGIRMRQIASVQAQYYNLTVVIQNCFMSVSSLGNSQPCLQHNDIALQNTELQIAHRKILLF